MQMLGPTGRYFKDPEAQEAIAGQLAKIGIRVTNITPEWSQYVDQLRGSGRYSEPFDGLVFHGTGGEILDCDRTLVQWIDSTSSRLGYYRVPHTPEIDAMTVEQRSFLDPEKLKAKLWEIQEKVGADVPWLFLYDLEDIYGLTLRVEWIPRVDEFVWAYDIKVKR